MNINVKVNAGLHQPPARQQQDNSAQNEKPLPQANTAKAPLTKNNNPAEQDTNDLANALNNSKYAAAFDTSTLDFSNMTINEFHQVVKAVIEIDRDHDDEFGSEEPTRLSANGNELISHKRSALLDLGATLEILSYGEGDIDPNEKIDVLQYFEKRSENLTSMAKTQPKIYSTPAAHSRELVQTLDNYFTEDALLKHQEQAMELLEKAESSNKKNIDLYV